MLPLFCCTAYRCCLTQPVKEVAISKASGWWKVGVNKINTELVALLPSLSRIFQGGGGRGLSRCFMKVTGLSYDTYSEWCVVGNRELPWTSVKTGTTLWCPGKNYDPEEIILDLQSNHPKSNCGNLWHILSSPQNLSATRKRQWI